MIYNGTIKKEELKDKYVFWDIDGTLAPFRFRGHLSDPLGTEHGMSLVEIEEGCFFERQPSKFMQDVLKSCGAKEHLVLGHCHADKEISDKQKWLDIHFPYIKRRFLVADEVLKHEVILDFCKKNDIDVKDTVFIDDTLGILKKAERNGIKSFHISSFLDWNY